MKYISIIISIFLFTSCLDNKTSFEKEYYEKVTGIKFPDQYTVLETFDNGEFLTGTVFKMDSLTLIDFVHTNHFDQVYNVSDIRTWSASYLIKNKPVFASYQNLYFLKKSNNKNHWTYIADLNSSRLWTEISYPDWGGQ